MDWADSGDAFEALAGRLDYPMFVVTAVSGGQRAGCLVGFATQVSIQPRRFLVGLSDKNHTYRVASSADRLAVHVLAAEDVQLAQLFGEQTGDDTDKFAQCEWKPGPEGFRFSRLRWLGSAARCSNVFGSVITSHSCSHPTRVPTGSLLSSSPTPRSAISNRGTAREEYAVTRR